MSIIFDTRLRVSDIADSRVLCFSHLIKIILYLYLIVIVYKYWEKGKRKNFVSYYMIQR